MNYLFFLTFLISSSFAQKEYIRNYYPNGKLKEEGWISNAIKTDYWFYYYENGNKKEEGHYQNNKKTNWWIFYNEKQLITKKCEYKNNQLNGLTILYEKGMIIKAEKYSNGKKIKTWTKIEEFKKDNFSLN